MITPFLSLQYLVDRGPERGRGSMMRPLIPPIAAAALNLSPSGAPRQCRAARSCFVADLLLWKCG